MRCSGMSESTVPSQEIFPNEFTSGDGKPGMSCDLSDFLVNWMSLTQLIKTLVISMALATLPLQTAAELQ